MTINEAKEKFVAFVRSQLGTREGANNYNKYADDPKIAKLYGWVPQNQPWCCTFTNWCYLNCFGYDIGSRLTYGGTAACRNSADLFKSAGAFVKTPEIGDQAFYYVSGGINHTGIVVSIDGNSFQAVEGNYSDKVSLVTHKIYGGDVAGFGRPNWKLVEGVSESSIPDTNTPVEPANTEKRILRKGMSGTDVLKVQENLIKLGYDLGRWGADGDFGRDTREAVKKFQTDYKVEPIDGEVGPITYAAIDEALKKKKEESGKVTNIDAIQPDPKPTIVLGGNIDEETPVVIKPVVHQYPSIVIGGNIEDEIPDDGYRFHIGDIVHFIGNGWYLTANGRIGIKVKQQDVLIIGTNHSAAHPYRIRPLQRFSVIGSGWVDEDALKELEIDEGEE